MRLSRLILRRYGCFEMESLAFDPTPGRLNVVLAANGVGKSVLRRAFADLLCGIHPQTPMGFRFGYAGMHLSAEAVLADGATLAFGRRKGVGNTLTDAEGAALDPAVLQGATGPLDRALLERLFALDTELLRRGGEGLLASGGALSDALVSAAGGLRQARGLLGRLREGRDLLAPERRIASRPFHAALDQFATARRASADVVLTPEAWAREQAAQEQAVQRQGEANAAAQEAAARIAALERLRRVRPLLAAHDAAAAWLDAHPDAPVLPDGLGPRLVAARAALAAASEARRARTEERIRVEAALAALAPDPAILAEAEALAVLESQAGAARKAGIDLPAIAAEGDAASAAVARLEHELGLPPGDAMPPPMALREARRLIPLHDRLAAARARLPTEHAARTAEAEAARAALDALPPPGEENGLAALLREIRGAGDPVLRAEAVADAARRRRAEADAAMASLVPWRGTTDALTTLAVPAPETLDALETALAAAERRAALAAQADAAAELALAAARARLATLDAVGDLVDPNAVAAARAHRDRGWDLVFRQGFSPQPPAPQEVSDWTGGAALPLAYAAAVARADALADRREALADRIAAAGEAARVLAEAEARQSEAVAAHEAARAGADAEAARLRHICAALGLSPSLAALRSFLPARATALAALREAALAEAARDDLAASHADWTNRLADTLAVSKGGLAALLAEADLRHQRSEAHRTARAEAAAALRQADAGLRDLARRTAEAKVQDADFQAAWEASQTALGRPPGEAPELVRDILDLYADLAASRARRDDLAARVLGMHRDMAAFRDSAAALAARLGAAPDLPALRARLDAAQATAGRLAELTRARDRARAAEDAATVAATSASATLAEITDAAGAADADIAASRIALSAERAAQAASRDGALAALAEAGDGADVASLRDAAVAMPAERLALEMAEAEAASEAARLAAQDAASEAARLAARLDGIATDLRAVSARADEEAALATLGRVLDEALVLNAAAVLLEQGLLRVEAAGTGPLLARIGRHFAALTDGAYDRVVTEEDSDGTVQLRVRQGGVPDEPKRMHELSEGTRDQLFLALRLVAIEDHMRAAPALPFVADDILQTFDNARAACALGALAGLSSGAQVIVLTHHPHVAEMGRQLGAHVQEIG